MELGILKSINSTWCRRSPTGKSRTKDFRKILNKKRNQNSMHSSRTTLKRLQKIKDLNSFSKS